MAERLKQLELVGRGGCSEVYRGILSGERGTSRRVAIKRLRPDAAEEPHQVDLFVNEARIAVQVGHPAVVSGLEFSRDDEGYYLVCEWIDGVSLGQLAQRVGPLPAPAVVVLGKTLADALCYLHELRDDGGNELGLVHRDITPDNVFVTRTGQPKLGDFGVACWRETAEAARRATVGTPGFAAPEQQRGDWGPESDIYGLGATLKAVAAELPDELAAVLERATAEEPRQRYESARRFREALGEAAREAGDAMSWADLADLVADAGETDASNPPSLDGALRSILGGSVAIGDPVAQVTPVPPAPKRSHRRTLLVGVVGVVAIAAALYGLLVPSPEPVEPTAETAVATPTPVDTTVPTVEAAVPSEPVAATPPSEQSPAPQASPEEARAPSDTAPPVAKHRVVETPRPRPPPAKFGTISLNAIPWAKVQIDGQALGNTPLRAMRLTAGPHQVTLIRPAHSESHQFTIEVDADRSQTFVIDLRQGTVSKRVAP